MTTMEVSNEEIRTLRAEMSQDFGDVGMRTERIKLLQSNTPETEAGEGEAGHWFSSMSGDLGAEIKVVPLRYGVTRIFNNPDKPFGDAEIVCSSRNGVEGTLSESDYSGIDRITGDCKTCPFAKWTTDDEGKRVKPKCTESLEFQVYEVGEGIVGEVGFSGSAYPIGENILGKMAAKQEWATTAFTLKSRKVVRGVNTYYAPVARLTKAAEVDDEWFVDAAAAA